MRAERRHSEPRMRAERKGSVTLEFIIAFPIVFVATIAIAEFFFLSLVIEGGTTALYEGTREGAEAYPVGFPLNTPAGGNPLLYDDDIADKIVAVIDEHLSVYNVEVADPDNGFPDDPDKQNATVIIERGGLAAVTRPAGGALNQLGAAYSCTRAGPAPAANEIVVTLCFEIVDASDPDGYNGPVPDWLTACGFSLNGTTFEMTARASLE